MPYNLFSQVVKSLFTLIWCCALMYYPAAVPCSYIVYTYGAEMHCKWLCVFVMVHGGHVHSLTLIYESHVTVHAYISIVQIIRGVRTAVNKHNLWLWYVKLAESASCSRWSTHAWSTWCFYEILVWYILRTINPQQYEEFHHGTFTRVTLREQGQFEALRHGRNTLGFEERQS